MAGLDDSEEGGAAPDSSEAKNAKLVQEKFKPVLRP